MDCTFCVAKTKELISVFIIAYGKIRFLMTWLIFQLHAAVLVKKKYRTFCYLHINSLTKTAVLTSHCIQNEKKS